ncbi:helix-turn-helix domain-containing protein [Actinoallomurus iriomotensis]
MRSQKNGESGPPNGAARPYGPRSPDDRPDLLLTPKEVAAMFGISVPTLATWARDGALPYVPTPGGHRRYRRADVRALLEKKNTAEPARTEMEEDAVRLYEQGWSIRQVAERFECGYGAMRRILARHGVLRSRKQAADDREGPSLGTFS